MCWSTALEEYFSPNETLALGRVASVLYTCPPSEKIMGFSSQKGRERSVNSYLMKEHLLKKEWLIQMCDRNSWEECNIPTTLSLFK